MNVLRSINSMLLTTWLLLLHRNPAERTQGVISYRLIRPTFCLYVVVPLLVSSGSLIAG